MRCIAWVTITILNNLSTLTGSLPVDGTMAKSVLNEINREVQSMGWHFNTHYKSTLSKDSSGKIPLANNVLRVELDPYKNSKTDFDIVQNSNMSKFCNTEEEATKTVLSYQERYKKGLVPYDSPYKHYLHSENKWVVKNRSTGKILKSINYTPVKWNA